MEMWCPDDTGRDCWDWVGPTAWGRACFNSPRVRWRLLACSNGASPDCIVVVVVVVVVVFVRWADLSDFFRLIFVGKMYVFVSRPMKIVTFLRKNDYSPKRVVDFPRERDTLRNKIMEIAEDFHQRSYNNNGKPWKSSRILRVKSNFFIFLSFFIIFLHFFVFFSFFSFFHFCSFFHFVIFFHLFHFFACFFFLLSFFPFFQFFSIFHFSFIFFHFLSFSFIFFHFRSFSFIFVHFRSFSFIFFHFLSFSLSLLGAQNLIFSGP